MSPQMWLTVIGLAVSVLLVPFVAWLVKENTSHRVAMANMRAEFVTWEHWRRMELWREEQGREFTQVRQAIQQVELQLARMQGPTHGG